MDKLALLRDKSKSVENSIIARLIAGYKINKILPIISEDDFLHDLPKKAYRIIKEAHKKEQDILTRILEEDLFVSDFIESDFRDVKILAKELRRISKAYKINYLLLGYKDKIDNRNLDSVLDELIVELTKASNSGFEEKTGVKDIIAEFEETQAMYSDKIKNGQKLLGISCGFTALDNIIDGIRPGHFWVLGGYSNTGKTFFAVNIIKNLLEQNKRVVMYSLEMSKQDIIGRLLGIMCDMNGMKILKGLLTDEEQAKVMEAKAKLYESRLTVYTELDDYEEIKMSMLSENMKEKVDLFVIDYMQLLKSSNLNEYQLMTIVSSEFQSIGRKTGVATLALSQISNEAAKSPNSNVGGYKGSGGIEASSDLAIKLIPTEDIELQQKKQHMKLAIDIDCLITKNRHGIKGKLPFYFTGYTGTFKQNNLN